MHTVNIEYINSAGEKVAWSEEMDEIEFNRFLINTFKNRAYKADKELQSGLSVTAGKYEITSRRTGSE